MSSVGDATGAFASRRSRRRSIIAPTTARRGSRVELLIVDKDGESKMPQPALLADIMDKVGSGFFHFTAMPCLVGVFLVEYSQIQLISGIASRLQREWGLSDWEKAALPTFLFLGLTVGTGMSGFLSDAIGRRNTILIGYLLTAIFSVALLLSFSFAQMVCVTFLNGVACAIGVPAALVLMAELYPRDIRAVSFLYSLPGEVLGDLITLAALRLCMPDLEHGSWRSVVAICSVPAVFLLVASIFFLRESPYWLVIKGRVDDARVEILTMARLNGTLEHVEALVGSLDADVARVDEQVGSSSSSVVLEGFKSQWPKLLTFIFLCFVGQLLTLGMTYLWPQLLQSSDLQTVFTPATALAIVRSAALWTVVVMIPIMASSLGHRQIIGGAGVFVALALLICNLCVHLNAGNAFVLWAGLCHAGGTFFYLTIIVFMTESYPTTMRASLSGLTLLLARPGAFLGPELAEFSGFTGFLGFAATCAVVVLPMLMAVEETKGKQLEDYVEDVTERSPLLTEAKV